MQKVNNKEELNTLHASNADKAGEEYWTEFWKSSALPEPFRITGSDINTYPNKVLNKIFKKIFGLENNKGKKLLEIGCGNSVLLSYFAKTYGFEIYGIDYSAYGCEQSKKILERDHVKGVIMEADAFNPPNELLNNFDFVCSFGVVEHFADTASTLRSFARFLKPGGTLVTSIPNLAGVTGILQKVLNKQVYDIHIPMDKKQLDTAIEKSGMELQLSQYFLSISFAVTLTGLQGERIGFYRIKKIILMAFRYFSKCIWFIENLFGSLPAGKWFSGGIITASRKPGSQ